MSVLKRLSLRWLGTFSLSDPGLVRVGFIHSRFNFIVGQGEYQRRTIFVQIELDHIL
ncbi:hypothetical protein CY34DRAFT_285839 [Suillus luteus UH-Slu-Lm8-n1]|uniref:Uncharacterized protein n=1 Tax=Suillus luteus UH-Slu-Lm8-n1 TaxID=930992 RepID=A0A0D0B0N8_9AGAM|nr:hypothetical protein CY34DRAFT_285839 [Suillus luteus UH-Slu-Lm8-n1]